MRDRRPPLPPSLATRGVTGRQAEVLGALTEHRSNADIAAALGISVRTVESHVSSLLAKFGVPTRSALVELGHQLSSDWRKSITVPAPLVALADRGHFVGRAREIHQLRRYWRDAAEGQLRLVLLAGEAGIGKSRLAAELAVEAGHAGALVLYGRCDEELPAPYQAFGEAIAAYLRACPATTLESQLAGLYTELPRLVPWLLSDIPTRLDALPTEPELARYRLFEAVRLLVRGAAAEHPLLLILDDLHWASRPTLLLLRHLVRGLEPMRVLVVGTYRDTEPGDDLAWFLADARRDIAYARLSLRGLDTSEISELVRGTSDGVIGDPSGVWTRAIHAETNGNPFFVVEMLRHLRESRDADQITLSVPSGVREVVGLRIRRLSARAGSLLGVAAVLGDEFELAVLRNLAGLDDAALLDALDEATAAALVYEVNRPAPGLGTADGGGERYGFGHAIVRRTLLGQLSLARRRRLHAMAASVLQDHDPTGRDDRADEIARHLVEAGDTSDRHQTRRYLIMAGRSALRSAAFEEALRYFEQGLTLAGDDDSAEEADLHFQLGVVQRSLAQWDAAIASWRMSLRISSALSDVEAVARVCEAASYNLMWALRSADAIDMARHGLAALGGRRCPERGRLLGVFAFVGGWAGLYKQSSEAVDEELLIAHELGDEVLRGHGLAAKAMQRTAYMQHREAAEAGEKAAEILRRHGELWHLTNLLGFLHVALVGLGRLNEARRVSEELHPLAERLGNYGALSQGTRMDAMISFFHDGDPAALEAFACRDIEFCRAVGIGLADHSQGWLGLAKFLRGDWAGAKPELEEAMRMEPEGTTMAGWAWAFLFDYYAYTGQRETALAMLHAKQSELPHAGRPNPWGSWVVLLSAIEGLVVLDERADAAKLYPLVLDCISSTGAVCINFRDGRLLERVAGIAAAAGGRWEAADRHFRTALDQARNLPHRVEEAHTLRFYAQMHIERNTPSDREQAKDLLQQAEALYGRMGIHGHMRLAESEGPE